MTAKRRKTSHTAESRAGMPGDFPTTSVRKDSRSGSEHPGELQMQSAFSLVRAPLMFVQNWLSPLFERPQAYTKSPAQSSQWPFHTASRTNNGGPRHRLLELPNDTMGIRKRRPLVGSKMMPRTTRVKNRALIKEYTGTSGFDSGGWITPSSQGSFSLQWSPVELPWSAEKSGSQSRKSSVSQVPSIISLPSSGSEKSARREASASRERQRTAPYPSEISWLTKLTLDIKRGLGLEQPKEEAKTPAYDETLAEATELDRRLEERRLEGIFTLPKDAPNVIKEARSPYFSIEMDQQPMTAHDISTLDSGEWLNDEVINFYMLLINKRSGSNPKLPKVHAFSSFFFNMLDGSGYARVRRWTRRINLFEKDMVVVPVNIDNRHWVCMVIDFRSKYITYYDSMLSGDYRRRDVLLNYLRQESEDKLKKPFDETGWATVCATDIPTQGNGYDCGVFTSAFAEYVSRDAPLVFSQKRCGFLREKMVYEIATMKLIS